MAAAVAETRARLRLCLCTLAFTRVAALGMQPPSEPSSLTSVCSVTRQKVLTTGKAVFEVEFALLHQQREMNFLKAKMCEVKAEMGEAKAEMKAEVGEVKAEMGEITRMLRLLVKDSAQV